MQLRSGEALDQPDVLQERPRPAVHQDERRRVLMRGARVHRMDLLSVDLGHDVVERVEAVLVGPPVEVQPRRDQPVEVCLGDSGRGGVIGRRAGRAGLLEPIVQVVDVGLRDLDGQWTDRCCVCVHGVTLSSD